MKRRPASAPRLLVAAASVLAGTLFLFPAGPAAFAADEVDQGKIPPPVKRKVEFARDVKPLFARCKRCHDEDERSGGLRLDSRAAAEDGGDSGPAWEAGKSGESLIVQLTAGAIADKKMPPPNEGNPLTTEEVGVLRAWIDSGALWPDD